MDCMTRQSVGVPEVLLLTGSPAVSRIPTVRLYVVEYVVVDAMSEPLRNRGLLWAFPHLFN